MSDGLNIANISNADIIRVTFIAYIVFYLII